MMTTGKAIVCTLFAASLLTLASCAADQKMARIDQAPTGMHEITSLYEKATAHHRRAVRKPIRDERARMMRLLAEKTERFIAETDTWDSEARLTAKTEPERDQVRQAVHAFREALRGLKGAAERSNVAEARSQYANVMATYRRVDTLAGPSS